MRIHGVQFHWFADDIQIYLTTSSDRPSLPDSLHNQGYKALDVLNNKKTEILVNGPATSVKRMDLSFDIDGVHVKPPSSIVTLVSFWTQLSFCSYISSVVKNSFFPFAQIRSSLTLVDADTLIHASIDYSMFSSRPGILLTLLLCCMIFTGYPWHHVFILRYYF